MGLQEPYQRNKHQAFVDSHQEQELGLKLRGEEMELARMERWHGGHSKELEIVTMRQPVNTPPGFLPKAGHYTR
jgi:hypothetical protein